MLAITSMPRNLWNLGGSDVLNFLTPCCPGFPWLPWNLGGQGVKHQPDQSEGQTLPTRKSLIFMDFRTSLLLGFFGTREAKRMLIRQPEFSFSYVFHGDPGENLRDFREYFGIWCNLSKLQYIFSVSLCLSLTSFFLFISLSHALSFSLSVFLSLPLLLLSLSFYLSVSLTLFFSLKIEHSWRLSPSSINYKRQPFGVELAGLASNEHISPHQ